MAREGTEEEDDSSGEEESGESGEESSSEEDIDVDEDGRLAIGGKVDLTTRCFDSALVAGGGASPALLSDCAAAFTARAKGVGEELSAGATFWIPADVKPTTALERVALQVFLFHSRDAIFDVSKSGAEWWTQVIDPEDDIGLHWDRDYDLQADQGLLLHPYLATVTYLSAPTAGAPTIVLDRPSPLMATDSAAGPVSTAHACSPAAGRHLCFDGKLLHGALSDLAAPARGEDGAGGKDGGKDGARGEKGAGSANCKRVTLLVNVWLNHKPWGAEPLPDSIRHQLRAPTVDVTVALGGGAESVLARTVSVGSGGGDAAPMRKWEFGEKGGKMRLCLPWPSHAGAELVLHAGDESPFLRVDFDPDSGAQLSAAPVPSKKRGKGANKKLGAEAASSCAMKKVRK
jgi:hypothetical protein